MSESSKEKEFKIMDLATVESNIKLVETDKTWQDIDSAIQHLSLLCTDNQIQDNFLPTDRHKVLIKFLKNNENAIKNSINTERTRLTGSTVILISNVAKLLKNQFLPFVPLFIEPCLDVFLRTNKVAVTRAYQNLKIVTEETQLEVLIPIYLARFKSITKGLRLGVVQLITDALNTYPNEALTNHTDGIQTLVNGAANDSAPEVREASRTLYSQFIAKFPELKDSLESKLNLTAKKNLKLISNTDSTKPTLAELKRMARNKLTQNNNNQLIN